VTTTREVMTSADVARSRVGDAKAHATEALSRAYELMEEAAGHGWDGVAASMRQAHDALEVVVASLDDADEATDAVARALSEVTNRSSRSDVTERFAGVLQELDRVRGALDAAAGSVDDARQACHRAGEPRELLGMLHSVSEGLDAARHSAEDAREKADTERQESENWGN
jgi:ATP/maltotriose-dependent transcriptional regulator MalT